MEHTLDEKLKLERANESKKMNKKFMKETKSDEILIIILKAHLFIERELIKILTETIIDEKVLNAITFRQKLDLANSMGLLDDYYGVLGKVNSVRNKYAHDIGFEFTEKDYDDLLATLTKEDKDDFLLEYEKWKTWLHECTIPEFNFKAQLLLSNIWFAMVSCRASAKEAIELRLKEKQIETMSKYLSESNNG